MSPSLFPHRLHESQSSGNLNYRDEDTAKKSSNTWERNTIKMYQTKSTENLQRKKQCSRTTLINQCRTLIKLIYVLSSEGHKKVLNSQERCI